MHNNLKIKDNVVGYDTETTGVNPYHDPKARGFYPARPFAFSFCDIDGNTAYFRLDVDPFTRRVIPDKTTMKEIGAITGNRRIVKVGHNISFDIRMTEFSDIPHLGKVECTLNQAHVITGGSELSYGAKDLGVKFLGLDKDDESELHDATKKARTEAKKLGYCIATKEFFGDKAWKADYWLAPPDICKKYAISDAERTILFHLAWKEDILNDENLNKVYKREMKILWIAKKMEERGVRIFPKDLKRLRKDYEIYSAEWLYKINVNGGKGLNLNSPKQMIKKFFIDKEYTPKKWGNEIKGSAFFPELDSKKNPKCDGKFLKSISHEDKLAGAILEYKASEHMITGFLDPYEKFRVQESEDCWIIHPNYKQNGCRTNRFSCGDPNMMQVAAPDGGGKVAEIELRPREVFGPREGHIWYLPDYSQIEVWLFAYCSGEKAMIKALHSGHDFHGSIAEEVWGDESGYGENRSFYRKRGKLLMFCKIYGGGAGAVADLLRCSVEEARGFINEYERKLPGVRQFMKRMVNRAERDGKIVTPLGRIFYIDPRRTYISVNTLIQGLAAEIMKEAMIAVDELLEKRWKGCGMLLTIHDELVISVPLRYHSKRLMREVVTAMQGNFHKAVGCPVPLPVSVKYNTSRWSNSKKVEL